MGGKRRKRLAGEKREKEEAKQKRKSSAGAIKYL